VSLGPSDFLALLEVAGSLKTRFAQTVQTPKSAPSVVLSQCQWDEVKQPIAGVVKAGCSEPGFIIILIKHTQAALSSFQDIPAVFPKVEESIKLFLWPAGSLPIPCF